MKKVISMIKKNNIVYSIFSLIYLMFQRLYFGFFLLIFSIFPINKNKVMIISYYGKGYGDSGKYIANELLKNNEFIVYWASNSKNSIPEGINFVKYNSIVYLFHLATSKFWINNTRFRYGIRKRKNQFYIQVWHGGLALKRVEYDVLDDLSIIYKMAMKNDNKMIDLMVSNSKFCTEMYRKAFRYDGEIIEVGTPRNDILVNNSCDCYKKIISDYYNFEVDSKILLYAPTFRNNYDENPYDIDFIKVKEILNSRLGDNWKILIRLHPNIKSLNLINYNDNLIDATNYPDMQELISACDLLITDYSSTMFESLIANKPVVLYAKDIEMYKKSRGYYFKFDNLPFMLAKNNDELFEILSHNSLLELKKDYKKFISDVSLKETGKASKKIVEVMKKNK